MEHESADEDQGHESASEDQGLVHGEEHDFDAAVPAFPGSFHVTSTGTFETTFLLFWWTNISFPTIWRTFQVLFTKCFNYIL